MEEDLKLQAVTRKLLSRVEGVLDEEKVGVAELKNVAAILKDVRELQKENAAREGKDGGIRVVLEGEVAGFGG